MGSVKEDPASSINQTLVTAGSLDVAVVSVLLGAVAVFSDFCSGGVTALAGAALRTELREAARGVACGVIAGGATAVVAVLAAGCWAWRAKIEASRAGSWCTTLPLPASESAGAGPMAAPTPTPMVS